MKPKLIVAFILASASAIAAETTQVGLQLWSLRAQLTASIPDGMAEAKKLGFTEVESAGTYKHPAKELRDLADANGLKIVGAHIPYGELQNDLAGSIAQAKTLGASYVIVAWVPHDKEFDVDQAKAAAKNFNLWGAEMKKAGLGFGFHTHGYEFKPLADGSSAFDVMMSQTDPDLVFCEMDVFWVVQGGIDPVKLLQKYPGRFKAFHIKDMKKGAPIGLYEGHAPASDNVIVGQGLMDWPGIIAQAKKSGVQYYFIEDETSDPIGNIPPSLDYLATLGLKP
ncbi:MAG TPA: sugar phosphate isomerase/epimerase [Opitutaceae bacterium]|nr:sugar phosphate isomerase/epimerase [Opitutaceae bacterium]